MKIPLISKNNEQMRRYARSGLTKLLVQNIIFKILIPLVLVMSFFFMQARSKMKEQEIGNIKHAIGNVGREVDKLFENIQIISDRYAYDQVLNEYIDTYYGVNLVQKRLDLYELKKILENPLKVGSNEKIAAIYTKYGEIFNFLEISHDDEILQDKLLTFGIVDKKNLSVLKWHISKENILLSEEEQEKAKREAIQRSIANSKGMQIDEKAIEIRTNSVLLGTRRLINPFTGVFNYSQIFLYTEEDLYNAYAPIIEGMSAQLCIIDENGIIISATDPYKIHKPIPRELFNALGKEDKTYVGEIRYNGEKQLLCSDILGNKKMKVVAMMPAGEATKPVDVLFMRIMVFMGCGIIICIFIIINISKHFLKPIDVLNDSMKAVYRGNMTAYVEMKGHGEIQKMGEYYNSMLYQINNYIEDKVETEKKKKQLELEVLMGQVNPHFLYNTLENIVWKSQEAKSPEIGRMAASLGRLYRLSISNGDIIVKVQREIEHLMSYITIQKMRYKERVDFELIMDHEELREYQTIKMTLQPAVENCFMYAMEGKEETLNIVLKVKLYEKHIKFLIADNGCGMTREQLERVREQIRTGKRIEDANTKGKRGTGIGLYSIKERIRLYFGEENAVRVHSSTKKGTVVSITIPKISAKSDY